MRRDASAICELLGGGQGLICGQNCETVPVAVMVIAGAAPEYPSVGISFFDQFFGHRTCGSCGEADGADAIGSCVAIDAVIPFITCQSADESGAEQRQRRHQLFG